MMATMTDYAIISPPSPPPEFDRADRLRLTLRRSGISVGNMASYLGVSRTTLSRWLNGSEPNTAALRLWAMRCGVTYEWLLTGDQAQATAEATP
jgi:transcriptional regulator with XRE-family HTH domain